MLFILDLKKEANQDPTFVQENPLYLAYISNIYKTFQSLLNLIGW